MKKGYFGHIEDLTKDNVYFRHVLYTGKHMQLVLMSLLPGDDIGLEIHEENDQFFRFDAGEGKVIIGETVYEVTDGDAIVVPAGTEHNVINTSDTEYLKFYTIYAPSHHNDAIVRETKDEAMANEEYFDGTTTE